MFFNLSFRKILLIGGFVILVVGLGFGIYFTFFKAPAEEAPEIVAPTVPTGVLPTSGLAKPAVPSEAAPEAVPGLPTAKTIATADITLTAAGSATLSSDGSAMQYYDSASGLFYKVDASGALTPLSNKQFFQVQNATWSGDKNKAVLEYPDGSNIVYDFSTDKQATLPKHWEDFEFSSDNKKIISKSMGADSNNRWLVISDTDGTNTKIVSALGNNADKVQVEWSPGGQVVGFSRTGDPTTEFGTQEIYLIGQNQENFKSLKVQGLSFEAKWAEEGDRILYSVTDPNNNYKPTLWVTDASGDNVGSNSVKINLDTWSNKCVILSGYKAYCAVPKTLDDGAGLEPSVADASDDVFYLIDLETGVSTFVGEPESDYSVDKISVTNDENIIYFTDKATGALHQMIIK
ncbi:hypothetical protein KJ885_05325 [Patescibacteria group bacterium]|nr:hypothetical protein [Patescibacteria group bacterium]